MVTHLQNAALSQWKLEGVRLHPAFPATGVHWIPRIRLGGAATTSPVLAEVHAVAEFARYSMWHTLAPIHPATRPPLSALGRRAGLATAAGAINGELSGGHGMDCGPWWAEIMQNRLRSLPSTGHMSSVCRTPEKKPSDSGFRSSSTGNQSSMRAVRATSCISHRMAREF